MIKQKILTNKKFETEEKTYTLWVLYKNDKERAEKKNEEPHWFIPNDFMQDVTYTKAARYKKGYITSKNIADAMVVRTVTNELIEVISTEVAT